MKYTKLKIKLPVLAIALILVIVTAFSATASLFKSLISYAEAVAEETQEQGEEYYFEGYSAGMSDSQLHSATRIPQYEDDAPSITVLVHGQGGDASHWSNNEGDETEIRILFTITKPCDIIVI